jgi:queuine tRNA-ribosyltransferase
VIPSVFQLKSRDRSARRGELRLAHGTVQTPVFMPVGTQATVKTLSSEEVESLGYEIILSNTYHLLLRPGVDLIQSAGGIHKFMSWSRCVLTDSGGYQIFSLANRRDVTEEGVTFASHVDGTRHLLTPENVVGAQRRMGVDIAMCLDECPPYPVSEAVARDMMERTLRWAARCRKFWRENGPSGTQLFPIVQGATYAPLRKESARRTVEMDFPGYAVGGLSVGEPRDVMRDMVEASASELPAEKPRYLMGVGKPEDILEAVERGVDMFDCVLPTRNGRNGQALTWKGPLNLRNNRFRQDPDPIDPDCPCPACRRYSRQYISHLFRAGEYLCLRLVSLHNLAFMVDFMRKIRESIEQSKFAEFKKRFLNEYRPED